MSTTGYEEGDSDFPTGLGKLSIVNFVIISSLDRHKQMMIQKLQIAVCLCLLKQIQVPIVLKLDHRKYQTSYRVSMCNMNFNAFYFSSIITVNNFKLFQFICSGFRKAGLSFFKQNTPSGNNSDSSKQNQQDIFSFNFSSEDKKNKGGIFSFFR